MLLVLAAVSAVVVLTILSVINRCLLICHPNEVIILSGRARRLADGSVVGYRIIRGGRALRIPILEKAARMSLETMPVDLTVKNAYSKGGIPLHVEAIANVKIDSSEPAFGNAVERFLDKADSEVHEIAKDTLEGNLRGVLATLTPEEVNEDRLKFAQNLIEEADSDLVQLGLHLDTLKIQNVSDEAGYLDSLGRRKTAEVIAAARTAEAAKQAEAEEAEAESKQRAEVAKAKSMQAIKAAEIDVDREVKTAQAVASAAARKADAEQRAAAEEAEALGRQRAEVAKAQADQAIREAQISANRDVQTANAIADQVIETENNNLRVKRAELEKVAIIREKEAEVAGQKAQVQFEQELETERIALQQRRLTADVIEPARAKKESMELEAKGAAAPIVEKGQAQLRVLREMISTYQSANGEGEKIFMLNMLPEILTRLTETVGRVTIDKVSVIDAGSGNGNGHGIGRFVNQFPSAVLSLAEQLETATGVNILSQFQRTAPVATVVEQPPAVGKTDANT
jgi:flotillin